MGIAQPPEPDIVRLYDERFWLLDAGTAEGKFRSYDFVVAAVQRHHKCDLETAKRMVLSALKGRYP
jgi:hypothetical protein